jgi:hypothetical protein
MKFPVLLAALAGLLLAGLTARIALKPAPANHDRVEYDRGR